MNLEAEKRGATLPPDEIQRGIHERGNWFHNMNLGGVWTAPGHFLGDYPNVKYKRFKDAIPADLTGKSVLDIGCNGGFYSIEMKKTGRVAGARHRLAGLLPGAGALRR